LKFGLDADLHPKYRPYAITLFSPTCSEKLDSKN